MSNTQVKINNFYIHVGQICTRVLTHYKTFTIWVVLRLYCYVLFFLSDECLCDKNTTWANLTHLQIQEYLNKELHIPKKTTGLAKNKLICRSDPRLSSTILGVAGSALICTLFGLLFLSDMRLLILKIRAAFTGRPDLIRQLRRGTLKKKENKQLKTKNPKNTVDAWIWGPQKYILTVMSLCLMANKT